MPRSRERAPRRSAGPLSLVVSDQRDWHARQMEAALVAQGRASRADRSRRVRVRHDEARADLRCRHLGSRLPDAVHVRTLSAGIVRGDHEASRRAACAVRAGRRRLERSARDRALRRQVDDELSARARRAADAADLDDRSRSTRRAHSSRAKSRRGPLVLKPLFGSQGKGLRLIRSPDDLPAPDEVAGVYYLQRFEAVAGEDFRDYRLFVVRGRVIAAMMRRAPTWITNVKQGGEPWRVAPRRARWSASRSPRPQRGRRDDRRRRRARRGATAGRPCSRSTACRPGAACRRSRASTSPKRSPTTDGGDRMPLTRPALEPVDPPSARRLSRPASRNSTR